MKKLLAVLLAVFMTMPMLLVNVSAATAPKIIETFDTYSAATEIGVASGTAYSGTWGRAWGTTVVTDSVNIGNKYLSLSTGGDLQIRSAMTHYPNLSSFSTGKSVVSADINAGSAVSNGQYFRLKLGSSTWHDAYLVDGGASATTLKSFGQPVPIDATTSIFDGKWHNITVAIDMGSGSKTTVSVFMDGNRIVSDITATTGTIQGNGFILNGLSPNTGATLLLDNFKVYTYTDDLPINAPISMDSTTDVPITGAKATVAFSDPYINGSTFNSENVTIDPPVANWNMATFSVKDGVGTINFPTLASGEDYTLNVGAGVKTMFGKAITPPDSLQFTTVAGVIAPPGVSITSPTDGKKYTPGENVTITANADDNDGTVTSVEFYDGGTLIGTADTVYPYEATLENISDGPHILTAKAYDNDGGSSISAAVNITAVVNQAPTAAITFPTEALKLENGDNIVVKGTAEDPDGDGITTVEIFNNLDSLGFATVTGGTFSFPINNLQTGNYSLTAKATDGRGDTGESSVAISFEVVDELLLGYKSISYDDFTGYTGGAADGWTNKDEIPNGGTVGTRTPVVIDPSYGRNYGTSMQLTGTAGTNTIGIEKSLAGLNGNIVLKASILLKQTNNNVPVFNHFQPGTGGKIENFTLQFGKNGNIERGSNQATGTNTYVTIMKYDIDKWYDVKVEMNLNTKTQDIYINNVKINAEKLPIANTNLDYIATTSILKWDKEGTIVLDNISIEEGITPTLVSKNEIFDVKGGTVSNPDLAPINTKTIKTTFAGDMDENTFAGNVTLKDDTGKSIAFDGVYNNKVYTATINSPLEASTKYTLNFNDNVRDASEVNLSAKHRNIEFTTIPGNKVVSVVLKNPAASDAVVTDLKNAALTRVKVETQIKNGTAAETTTGQYIVASYKDNILVDLQFAAQDINIAAGDTGTYSAIVSLADNTGNNYKVRVYAWEALDTNIPIVTVPYKY